MEVQAAAISLQGNNFVVVLVRDGDGHAIRRGVYDDRYSATEIQ